jgi:tetratricopeptide (TPR) repeat protein
MNQYPRKPALIVLLVATLIGVVYVSAWGTIEKLWKKQPGEQSLEAMEAKITELSKAGGVPAATWRTYADALVEAKQYSKAAAAYKELLELEPFQRDAKFQRGLALAMAGASDEFFNYQKDLVYSEAKLAVELFERPETKKYREEKRFADLVNEAKNQAMD